MAYYKCMGNGGGSGAEILKGTSDPVSSQGSNGQIYLKYVDLANDYTCKDYLEVGSTISPYINTGLNSTRDTYCEIKFKYTDTPTNNRWFFGAFQSVGIIIGYQNGRTEGYLQSGGALVSYDTNDHIVEIKQDGIYLDEEKKQNGNWSGVPVGVPLYLFSRGGDNLAINNTRIYYAKIWQGGNLVRDFIPAERNSDNEIGMLDLVNSVFYTNSGTGSFTSGSTITPTVGYPISSAYAKVNGAWQDLIGTNINDIS